MIIYEVRSSEILRELDWQTLEKRRKCNKAIFMYKIKHTNEPPQCMANLFNVKNNTIGITFVVTISISHWKCQELI